LEPTNAWQGHFKNCGGHICNLGGSLAIVFKRQPSFQMWNIKSNIKQRFQITIGFIFYDLSCAKSHTLREYSQLWPCPIVYLNSEWLQNVPFEAPQNNAPHFLAPYILEFFYLFSPCGSWIVSTKMFHWRDFISKYIVLWICIAINDKIHVLGGPLKQISDKWWPI
jgi:hypothetical protein